MKTRFHRDRSGRPGRLDRLALLAGFGFVLAILPATRAAAEETEPIAAAEETEPEAVPAEPAEAPAPAAKPKPAPRSGIEEIVVRGAESEAAKDFEAADSVTGFGAEDLAALGVQDISDLASFTPNLEIVTAGATTPTFFIRGVGLNDFNSNSTGAVAIYQDDVAINAPALQLSTLFDVESVNVLRGPQGTGLARNASAGAIKIYSRKPTGEFGAFLRSDIGNFNSRDFEGAVEAPIYEDILGARLAFRFTERDGTMKNRCGNAPAMADRVPVPGGNDLITSGALRTDAPWSLCGETVFGVSADNPLGVSEIPTGLAPWVNDIGNWAARGTLLFQPTLDMSWLINAHGSRRDEYTRLGQSIGTRGFYCADGDVTRCGLPGQASNVSRVNGLLGGSQGTFDPGYTPPEIRNWLYRLAPCARPVPNRPDGTCLITNPNSPLFRPGNLALFNDAKIEIANRLAEGLDSDPWAGDFDRTGPTTNDTWGGYLKGEIVLPWGMQLTTVTGYDTYDRLIDSDLDFSPEVLFEIETRDSGWQVAQSLQLQGQLGDEGSVRWDIGGWFLREQLEPTVAVDLGGTPLSRNYTQDLWSTAGYASLAFDFWEDFTLDGGFRYNWEQKKLDYTLNSIGCNALPEGGCLQLLNDTWQAPTGTVRLTYRFREDTQAFWKYTRGFKPGTYNATSSEISGVTVADPESIDAFETGLRGSWLDGRLGLDLSLFYYSYTDYQIFTAQQFASSPPEFVILNAPSAEVYGAEIDAVIRPWQGSFINVRFGWLESQFTDFVQIQQALQIDRGAQVVINRELQNTGNPLLNSPRFKVSLTGEQTIPLGRFGSVTARYDGVWTDLTHYDATAGAGIPNAENLQFYPDDTISQPPYWVHNARLGYRPPGGRLEIAGWVRNITNEAYKTFAFDGSTFQQTSIYFVGDPRTYGGTITINF
jgi:outer membrane receptor protein involved in Fe transport